MSKNKVMVAMSGGIDSTISAILLQEGCEVVGMHMKLHNAPANDLIGGKTCCSADDVANLKQISAQFGFKLFVKDFSTHFNGIIDDFMSTIKTGGFTIPCTACNSELKFGQLFRIAKALGIDFIATGHYAVIKDCRIYMSPNADKDQSFFLWGIPRERIPFIIFPVGEMNKEDVRQVGRNVNLFISEKPESMGLCFAPKGWKALFSDDEKPNFSIIYNNVVIGNTNNYLAIGQKTHGKWVTAINIAEQKIIVSDNIKLIDSIKIVRTNWHVDNLNNLKVKARLRHRGDLFDVAQIVKNDDNSYTICFQNLVPAVSFGQTAVIYDDNDAVVGGGYISK